MNRYYELYSLCVGIGAIATITYFLIVNPMKCVIMFEPIKSIRITEIMMSFSVVPYYFMRIFLK